MQGQIHSALQMVWRGRTPFISAGSRSCSDGTRADRSVGTARYLGATPRGRRRGTALSVAHSF